MRKIYIFKNIQYFVIMYENIDYFSIILLDNTALGQLRKL